MKKDNKKALYESIMTSVAREVKKALNESQNYAIDDIAKEIEKEICKAVNWDDTYKSGKVNANNKPPFAVLMIFNKRTGDLEFKYYCTNRAEYKKIVKVGGDELLFEDRMLYVNYREVFELTGLTKIPNAYIWKYANREFRNGFVYITENTIKNGIQILIFLEEDSQNIPLENCVKDYVKNNLDKFEIIRKSDTISQEDIKKFDEYFSSIADNYEFITKNNTFAAYFPDRNTLINDPYGDRAGYGNIPHITISRPPLYKGNYKVTLHTPANRYNAREWPDQRRIFINNEPTSATPEQVIAYLEKTKNRWATELKVKLK